MAKALSRVWMKRLSLQAVCTAFVLVGQALPAAAADGPLTGEMSAFNHLVGGTWDCAVRVPALRGRSPQTVYFSETYDVMPRNVLHSRVAAGDVVGDQYYGYDTKAQSYWQAALDTKGKYGWATSPDGGTYTAYAWDRSLTDAKVSVFDAYANLKAQTHNGRFAAPPGNQAHLTGTCTRAQ